MRVRRSSWHYKLSYLGSDYERGNDNLCGYFWRTVGKAVLLLGVFSLASLLVYTYFTHLLVISNTILLLFVLSSLIVPPLVIVYIRKILGKSPEMPYGNVLTGYLKARKQKVCPLIEFV